MRIVFLGPPGAGKGTQAARLAARAAIPHVSTGDILRRAIELSTPTGIEARRYVDAGELVPFEIMLRLVKDRLNEEDASQGWILDGFPRNLEQARAFEEITSGRGVPLDHVVHFRLTDENVVRRLSSRRVCRSCQAPFHLVFSPPREEGICDRCGGELYQRSDDSEKAIRNRLAVYARETDPLVRHYEEHGILITVDASGEMEDVQRMLLEVLGS
ncbi:MAG: adenylate kinase [Planctomycetota bacterium]